ncbi:MAG: arylsulfatase [Alphaproteobacteria bacterium]|nr:MAG: arylsulfatase [Alphaproteobacteria bacterium]
MKTALRWCLLVVTFVVTGQGATAGELPERPNIVFILADDLGYSDLASYGSEISTPNITALANQGIRFTNYHTAANCAPARAMLLTGVSNHKAGVGNIPETVHVEARGHVSYKGVLGRNVVTVATLLQDSGYHTYLSGKWHLGQTPDLLPFRRGFERTVALADSGADNWQQRPYMPLYKKASWYADGEEFTLPEDFYSSRYLVDRMIEFIGGNADDDQPFFAFLSFQAVHIPVQAPQEFIDHYKGVYDQGWAALRTARLKGAIEKGIVPADTKMAPMSSTEDWDAQSAAEKRYQAKRMAVYAAMVEAMDHNIGRLIDHLKSTGEFDNTIFIFTSDNGTHSSGRHNQKDLISRFTNGQMNYSSDYETLGLKGSYNALSRSFASASSSPLSLYKFYTGEGGMRVPLIISGANLPNQNKLSSAFSFATDITPTILSLTGVRAPTGRYAGRPIEPMIGRDLMPVVTGIADDVYGENDPVGYELAGHKALFMGDHKIVKIRTPMGDGSWHLYDIVRDPGETTDLSAQIPIRFQTMLNHYHTWAVENGVIEVPDSYNYMRQIILNSMQKRLSKGLVIFLLTLLILAPFVVAWRLKKRGSGSS